MQRYFIDQSCIDHDFIYIDDYNHKHMQRVMRYRDGDDVICLYDEHVYLYKIINMDKGILEKQKELDENHELDVDITLIYSLPKNDKFEFVLQKSTELGVNRIVPLLSRRSIIKTDAKTFSKKYERYHKILKEASEQSYRNHIPELTSLIHLKDISQYLSDINLVAYEEDAKQGEHHSFYQAIHSQYQSITIIVGPEGGFDETEIDEMKKIGIISCSLGKRILRSETAPLYMLSVIGYSRELK
ncbi:MAG: 16S rRNA (uracil(1498)-N(3))-methyltransferase [Erysipelotrichaceae bacterium]|nr:16S rRNA (uracil(1498)-N(3))-methyltransferase [Erysipelotrichaceae bacterium]